MWVYHDPSSGQLSKEVRDYIEKHFKTTTYKNLTQYSPGGGGGGGGIALFS